MPFTAIENELLDRPGSLPSFAGDRTFVIGNGRGSDWIRTKRNPEACRETKMWSEESLPSPCTLANENRFSCVSTVSKFCETRVGSTSSLSRPARESMLQTSKLCTTAMVRQARKMLDLRRRTRPSRSYRLVENADGAKVYEQVIRRSVIDDPSDDVALLGNASDKSANRDDAPRMLGLTQVHATLDEFVHTFARHNKHGANCLNQGMPANERLHTLVDEPNKLVTVRWMVLQPRGVRSMARRRDFVMVECQKRFQMPDGRQGWVQSLESVEMPWAAPHERDANFVRGTMHHSGVVALESADDMKTIDVITMAEIDLQGSASLGAQRAASRRRVVKVLEALGGAIEQHRVERLSFPGTRRFMKIEVDRKDSHCKICNDRLAQLPRFKARHTCRKCGESVCGQCSQTWSVERQRSSVMVGGGRVTTQTRVCTDCQLVARNKDVKVCEPRRSTRVASPAHAPVAQRATSLPLFSSGASEVLENRLSSVPPMCSSMLEFKLSRLAGAASSSSCAPFKSVSLTESEGTTTDDDDDEEDDGAASVVSSSVDESVDPAEPSSPKPTEWSRDILPDVLRLSELMHAV